MKNVLSSISIFILIGLLSCSSKQKPSKPVFYTTEDLLDNATMDVTKVPYREKNGVKTIAVRINGVIMDMIFDTGCSGVHLSLNELQSICKNHGMKEKDFLGKTQAQIADGSLVENIEINLHTIEIGEDNGIVLKNIKASVAENLSAPALLGNAVFSCVARVEIDEVNGTINFYKY